MILNGWSEWIFDDLSKLHFHPFELNRTRTRLLHAVTILWIAFPLYRFAFIKIRNWINTKAIIKTDKIEKAEKVGRTAKIGKTEKPDVPGLMLFSCIVLWIMARALLPSSVIATSPTEFSFLGSVDSPLTYIFMNLTFYFGLFVFWPLCIYKMFQKQVKSVFPALFFGMTVCAVFNIYLFKSRFGNIKEYDIYAARLEQWQTDDAKQELQTEFSLTKTGHNVLVLFRDRAASAYFPERRQ